MPEPVDLRGSVGPLPVPYRNLDNLKVQFRGPEKQIKIAKRIKITEVASSCDDFFIIPAPEDFGSAQRVSYPLTEEVGEHGAEKFIAEKVQCAHGFLFHLINKAAANDELPLAGDNRLKKFREGFRRNGQIGIENHENVALRFPKSLANGIGLAFPILDHYLNVPVGIGLLNPVALGQGFILGMSLNEYKLRVLSHIRHALHSVLNISFFIAAGNYNGTCRVVPVLSSLARPRNHDFIQGQLAEERHFHDYPV